MADIQFAPTNMTAVNSPSPYVASASSYFGDGWNPSKAFDGNSTSFWASASTTTGWITIYVSTKYFLSNYSLQINPSGGEVGRAPKNWTFLGSSDGTNFTTLDTVTDQTGWSAGETRNFVCDLITGPFNYFRLNVTAINGGDLVQLAQMYLYGQLMAPPPKYIMDRGHNRLNMLPISLGRDNA